MVKVAVFFEEIKEMISFSDDDVPNGTSYAVRITDDTMEPNYPKEATVFIKERAELRNEDVGIFSLYGEMLCRRFIKTKGSSDIILKADNPKYDDIKVTNDIEDFGIVGKVIGVTGVEEEPKSRYW